MRAKPKPPHLRTSKSKDRRCSTCAYYKKEKCEMFNDYPVHGTYVCDKWTATR